ncbi:MULTISPECIES: tripartite tricarboxylate transporter permease [unclassified Roseitalea]|uniref:tripartite tricarboxylate transporter permease n=1 Tax=unclassified Roseitalea TaxID=2639107 RepID=UPI00274000E2|nr:MULTISPECIES: tripartite tricarboxylate transporter permease [unclassified Roseitalea]
MDLITPLLSALTPAMLFFVLVGVVLGITVGAIPGLTGSMLIALSLPFTFGMEPVHAMAMLIAMYVGGVSGSLITAVLMRMPGTAAAVMTTFDGYPMTQQGKAGRAIGLAIAASFVGGIVSWVFLVLLARPLSILAVRFSQFDFFAMIVMALVLLVILSKGNMIKGLIAGLLGMLISLPGIDPIGGNYRFTFGFDALRDGFQLLPVLVGLFAGNQVLAEIVRPSGTRASEGISQKLTGMYMTLADMRMHATNLVRSSVIGTWIGILPGVGANIGSAFAYSVAKASSRAPERFGHGSEEGVVASESANNATVGGALVPLISLGIPGSVIDAILIGGLIIHGLQPGPGLYRSNPEFVETILASVLVANVIMLGVMYLATGWIARIASIPTKMLLPGVLVLCVIGSYALANSWYNVFVMLAFSAVGFFMERRNYPLAPMVIGLVLAPIAETSFRKATMYTGGDVLPLVFTPIPLICMALTAIMAYLMFRVNKNA